MNRTRWKWMIAGLGLSLAGLAVAGVPEGAGGLSCISQSHQVARVMPEAPIRIPVPKVADLPPGNVAPPTLPELPPPANEPVGMPPGIPLPAPAPVPVPVPAMPVALPSPAPASLPTPEPVPVSIPSPIPSPASSPSPTPTPSTVPIPALPSVPTSVPAPSTPSESPSKPVAPPPAVPMIPAPNATPQAPAEVPTLPLPAQPAAATPAPAALPATVPEPEFKTGAVVPPSNPRDGNRSATRAPSLAKLNVHLHLGDERPRFEVRSEEVIYLKVTSDQVEVKSPPVETSTGAAAGSGAGLAQMRAQGRVRFVTPGGEGTCQELIVSPGTGQVMVSGAVSFTYNWGKLETTVTGEKMTFNLGATPGTTAGVPPGTNPEASAPAIRRTSGSPSDSPNP